MIGSGRFGAEGLYKRIKLDHYLIYQHSVQKFFVAHRDKYNGVVIPLSIIASFPGGTKGFIRTLCSKDRHKRYGIDPRTPLFQRKWDRQKHLRPPHHTVAEILGPPFSTVALDRDLVATDFSERDIRNATRRCVEFQLEFRQGDDDARKLRKYAQLLGHEEDIEPLSPPQYVVPPYFAFVDERDPWYQVNMDCIQEAMDCSSDVPVWPIVHSRSAAALPGCISAVARLRELGLSNIWLYPNDFREHRESAAALVGLKDVVVACHDAGVTPRMLHGGFFSMALRYVGLEGFANGVGYGEWRDSGYHRGGTADIRIYCLPLHRFIGPAEADLLVDENPEYFANDGLLFEEVYKSGESFESVDSSTANTHFMNCRDREVATILASDLSDVLETLDGTVDAIRQLDEPGVLRYAESLERWSEVLSS